MKIKLLLFVSLFAFLTSDFFAQDTLTTKFSDPKTPELKFIGYFFTRGTASNVAPTNELLRGQVIGRLFGPNTTNTHSKTALYFEQRFVPMFIYTPQILDGFATFRSLFKIDMTYGDVAYGVGGNSGGGINAGQVNLQTLLANVDLRPSDSDWNAVIGLQRMFDNVRDPNINAVSTFQNSAYKLSYWGTQGIGISVFGKFSPKTQVRFGYFQLYENIIQDNDDVTLWMVDFESLIHPLLEVGADAWFVWDRGKNAGGISVLGQGLNSGLAEYNGAVRLSFPSQKYDANVFWLGAHASYAREFLASRWWADGFVMANLGTVDTLSDNSTPHKYADILGVAVNAMVAYKYGMTVNDKISIEGLFTSGDGNGADDKKINSVITGNVYGSPVGIYSAHRSLLLFPDPQVVNRYYSVVQDISNMGLGVTAAFLNFQKDFIPNRFSGKIGVATALSNVKPNGGGNYMGTEVNVEFKYNLKVFLTVGVSAGYLALGDFFNAPSVTYSNKRPKDPWVLFTTLSWLMF